MPTLLIIGASSGIGLRTVEAALAAGHRIKALARAAPAIAIDDARLERIGGRQPRHGRPPARARRISADLAAYLRRQGRAGGDDPPKRPRLDPRAPGNFDKRTRNGSL
jgi:NAD(P)-dependent dehydrogenase (short-subunit alcohol dehydrogenase family)